MPPAGTNAWMRMDRVVGTVSAARSSSSSTTTSPFGATTPLPISVVGTSASSTSHTRRYRIRPPSVVWTCVRPVLCSVTAVWARTGTAKAPNPIVPFQTLRIPAA